MPQVTAGPVTVIGLGPMGQAMVKSLRASNRRVTVWNRSPEKADAMREFGAARATTVTRALDAGEVIVLSLTDYAAMYDILGPAADHLPGKTIVNLSSDTPDETRAAARWVRARGGRFLAGGVMADGEGLGGPGSFLFYSGEREVFDACVEVLRPLGRLEYLGVDAGLAQLYYQSVFAVFSSGLLAFEQALAMIDRSGEPIAGFLPYAQQAMGDMTGLYAAVATMATETGGWRDIGHLRMMAAGAGHVADTAAAVGVSTGLARAVQNHWLQALSESERAGEPVSTFQLIRGDTA